MAIKRLASSWQRFVCLTILCAPPSYLFASHFNVCTEAFVLNQDSWRSQQRRICFKNLQTTITTTTTPSPSSLSSSTTVLQALKVHIRIVGRPQKGAGEKWIEEAYSTYESRLRPANIELSTTWHKNNDDLCQGVDSDRLKLHTVVLLDPTGKTYGSEEFGQAMYTWLDRGGSRLSFVIGGAEGLPLQLKNNVSHSSQQRPFVFPVMSLSALTLTHQFARILLAEQIYRASEIRKGSAYHK